MKRESRNLLTTFIAILLLGGLVLFALKDVEKKDAAKEAEERAKIIFPELETETALKIAFVEFKERTELARENEDSLWKIIYPAETRADQDHANTTITFTKTLKSLRSIVEENIDYGKYNLLEGYPRFQITLASGKTLDLIIGEQNQFDNTYFARRLDRPGEVFFVSQTVADKYSKSFADLRQKTLFDKIKDFELKSIELKVGENTFNLVRIPPPQPEEGKEAQPEWRLAYPIEYKADKSEINKLVSNLNSLTASSFVSSEEAKTPEKFNLDKPAATMTLEWINGKKQTVTIASIQKDLMAEHRKKDKQPESEEGHSLETKWYARALEYPEEIAEVPPTVPETLLKYTVKDFRDKLILDFEIEKVAHIYFKFRDDELEASRNVDAEKPNETWNLIKPPYGKAKGYKFNTLLYGLKDLKATDFVEEAPKNFQQYGLEPHRGEVILKDKNGAILSQMFVGEKGRHGVYVTNHKKDKVYLLTEPAFDKLRLDPKDVAEKPPIEAAEKKEAERPSPAPSPARGDEMPAIDLIPSETPQPSLPQGPKTE